MRTLVIIPTYDEIDNLEPIVARTLAASPAEVHVLVADDASPDGTGELADRLAARHPRIHVLHRAGKEGLGAAYLAGFHWALERGYDAVVEMDADGSHRPEDLPRLIEELRGHEVVLGSRWVPGGRVENWPLRRRLLSRGGNAYARLALGIDVRDATGGYRVYSAEALHRLAVHEVASQGYCFQVEMLWRALERGLRVVEVPITFVERERGVSKMDGAIVAESLRRVTQWGLRRRYEAVRALVVRGRRLPSVRAWSHRALPAVPASGSTPA